MNDARGTRDCVSITSADIECADHNVGLMPVDGGDAEKEKVINEYENQKHNRYALCVGIDDYRGAETAFGDLDSACEDAKEIGKRLQSAGYTVKSLLAPKEGGSQQTKITSETIREAITEILKDVKQDDIFLFYFAGHGYFTASGSQGIVLHDDKKNEVNSAKGGNFHTLDFKQQIEDEIKGITIKRILIIDACQSKVGGQGGASVAWSSNDDSHHVVLNACRPTNVAHESLYAGHGFFTQALNAVIDERDVSKPLLINSKLLSDIKGKFVKHVKNEIGVTINEGAVPDIINQEPQLIPPNAYECFLPRQARRWSAKNDAGSFSLHIYNYCVEVRGDCVANANAVIKMEISLFETLCRFLIFLQELGLGSKDFQESVWKLISSNDGKDLNHRAGNILFPPLASDDRDISVIKNKGGIDEFARANNISDLLLELREELDLFADKFNQSSSSNDDPTKNNVKYLVECIRNLLKQNP